MDGGDVRPGDEVEIDEAGEAGRTGRERKGFQSPGPAGIDAKPRTLGRDDALGRPVAVRVAVVVRLLSLALHVSQLERRVGKDVALRLPLEAADGRIGGHRQGRKGGERIVSARPTSRSFASEVEERLERTCRPCPW